MPLGNPIQKNNDTRIVSSTATTGQTDFTITGGYTINAISVFRNGVRLSNSDDFTASDGSTVSLNVAADVGDSLDFHVFDKFTVANAIVGAASTQTINGNLRVTGELYSDTFRPDNINTTGIATVGTLDVTGTSSFKGALSGVVISGIITAHDGIDCTDAVRNTVIGENAGDSFDGTNAEDNTLLGYDAGTAITTGDNNTAVGSYALDANTTGDKTLLSDKVP